MRFYPWNIWEWGFSFNEGDTFVILIRMQAYRISLFRFHFVDYCVSFALYFVPRELIDQKASSLFSRTIDPRCDSSFYEIYVYVCASLIICYSP